MYGFTLSFSGPLDASSAQLAGNYVVTQVVGKKKKAVPVRLATYNAGARSVSLILGNKKPGKGLQVTVSGLRGAGGAPVATFSAVL
jgi:hypothetical protein